MVPEIRAQRLADYYMLVEPMVRDANKRIQCAHSPEYAVKIHRAFMASMALA